jgi:hypothetical protein
MQTLAELGIHDTYRTYTTRGGFSDQTNECTLGLVDLGKLLAKSKISIYLRQRSLWKPGCNFKALLRNTPSLRVAGKFGLSKALFQGSITISDANPIAPVPSR